MTEFFFTKVENEDDKEYTTNLYNQYYSLLKKQAYNITNEYSVVDDLIQDTFLKLLPRISLLRSLSSYKMTSYIFYTLKHVCLDYNKRKVQYSKRTLSGLTNDITDNIPDLQATIDENLLLLEELEVLKQALLQLSERDRYLLFYKYTMELSDREIAGLINIPHNHIRQYVARAKHRAFQKLSQRINDCVTDK
ncbi:sigma-70 family RNA polymerase sigma factor [Cohnella xylanilytica]|uniref:Sigma-70 family RNA polymerase sigma factor n=1 Tax=Cohnella xylanilytica TaxID=557555 RepID=A0A841TZ64_9BACL|nr:sigma-70 family RNA polymerase sigma factor [Cohnella xylanilytica]MBB6690944.1 sigma-70 family RNA polymerase sigma factor [Cohnella xylanilytica]